MKTTHTMLGAFSTVVTLMVAAACTAPAPSTLSGGEGSSSGSSGRARPSGEPVDEEPPSPEGPKPSPTGPDASTDGSGEPTPGGKGSVNGNVNGKPLTVADAFAYVEPGELTVKVTPYTGACELEKVENTKKNADVIKINVKGALAGLTEVKAGTYKVAAVPTASAPGAISGRYFDGTCLETKVTATAGSITFTSVSGSLVKGTFTATLAGKEVSGDFESPLCGVADGTPVGTCLD